MMHARQVFPVDAAHIANLEREDWVVPRCPHCTSCLRPNVLLFADSRFCNERERQQRARFEAFKQKYRGAGGAPSAVIEIGAGKVVTTIRNTSETFAKYPNSGGILRVNMAQVSQYPNHCTYKLFVVLMVSSCFLGNVHVDAC